MLDLVYTGFALAFFLFAWALVPFFDSLKEKRS